MSYNELIQRLFSVNLFGGMKLGLDNCLKMQTILECPDRSYATVHVAGTNGKGSVTTKIAGALQAEGYRVGLYTSPHLSCFRERIRVNGVMIPESATETILSSLFKITEEHAIPATFFELATFLALVYFSQERVDIAVLETGLGGRLDATNIIAPLLSVITSVSLDHTEILGETVEAIAKEKAGIVKPGVPILIGPEVPVSVVRQAAQKMSSPLIRVENAFSTYDETNGEIAKRALQQISAAFPLSTASLQKGLGCRQPCRFEYYDSPCPIILDVAHNPDGLLHLFKAVSVKFGSPSIRVLFGLSKNKDLDTCIKVLLDHAIRFHITEAGNGRGHPADKIQTALLNRGCSPDNIFIDTDITRSFRTAVSETIANNQILLICGSFFIMSEIRHALGIQEPRDAIDLNERWISKSIN